MGQKGRMMCGIRCSVLLYVQSKGDTCVACDERRETSVSVSTGENTGF